MFEVNGLHSENGSRSVRPARIDSYPDGIGRNW